MASKTKKTADGAPREQERPAAGEPDAAALEQIPNAEDPAPKAENAAQPGSRVNGVNLAMFVYRRKWYTPPDFRCPQCGSAVNATLLSLQGDVLLACTNKKCGFTDNCWGSWRAHKTDGGL